MRIIADESPFTTIIIPRQTIHNDRHIVHTIYTTHTYVQTVARASGGDEDPIGFNCIHIQTLTSTRIQPIYIHRHKSSSNQNRGSHSTHPETNELGPLSKHLLSNYCMILNGEYCVHEMVAQRQIVMVVVWWLWCDYETGTTPSIFQRRAEKEGEIAVRINIDFLPWARYDKISPLHRDTITSHTKILYLSLILSLNRTHICWCVPRVPKTEKTRARDAIMACQFIWNISSWCYPSCTSTR